MSAHKLTAVFGRCVAIMVFVLAVGAAVWMSIQHQRFQHMSLEEKVANHLQGTGVMSAQDDMRLNTLAHSIAKTGRISDTDLDWMLTLLKTPSPTPTEQNASTRSSFIAGDLRIVKNFGTSQEEKVLQAFLPMTSGANKGVVEAAVGMLGTLDDPRAVPYIRPLLNDSDATVRYYAWRALHHLHALPNADEAN